MINASNIVIAAQLLMEKEEDDILLLSLIRKRRRKVHNMFLKRRNEGCFSMLIKRHLIDDETKFREYVRLTRCQFNEGLNLVSADLEKRSSKYVKTPITSREKLALVLRYFVFNNPCRKIKPYFLCRYLATGESYRSMHSVIEFLIITLVY
ncbi:hypothetical protein NQ314_010587 [Rhamnusium bicolor]|uniref:Uncharacterized protein n=1 Tax=Rhamnusium bicolor TaxID=1586634 RepID=A0AAV8XRA0_9CUCU|nr:hypothetical protein NQ314_010587 [Rhamnusium bicolor]